MAKQLIETVVKAQKADALTIAADVLAVGFFQDEPVSGLVKALDKKLGGSIAAMVKLGDFEGKKGSLSLVYSDARIRTPRVLLVGLGKRNEVKTDGLRKAAALAATKTVDLKAGKLAMALHADVPAETINPEQAGQAMTEGAFFGAFRYDEYITDKNSRRPAKLNVTIVDDRAGVNKGVATGTITGQAQNYARVFCNRPANVINPVTLAAEAHKVCRPIAGLTCMVLDDKALRAKKMGGILAVGQGSATPPRLIVLHYKPAKSKAKGKPVALIGKAITFDSGGISIKPGEGMHDMKFDKSGGIAVLGAMQAIAKLKPNVDVYGLIPAAENMPSGKSYRPGDIVTTYSGKTVEIQNTDAEGRMILCDAITFAEKDLGCGQIIDVATLTGACVVALGQKRAGLMGNDNRLVEKLKAASEQTGERVWHLPSDDEFVEQMKSKVADLKNTGGRYGGACTAAAFLSQFAGKAAWAHLDIAGVSIWGAGETDAPGSIGFGVRLLTEFAMNS
jgi:leucyl aminopeptidase